MNHLQPNVDTGPATAPARKELIRATHPSQGGVLDDAWMPGSDRADRDAEPASLKTYPELRNAMPRLLCRGRTAVAPLPRPHCHRDMLVAVLLIIFPGVGIE